MSSTGLALSPIGDESLLLSNYLRSQFGMVEEESIFIYLAVSGSMMPLRVLESDSIESVKVKIQSCQGFVVKNQKLVCGGRELARSNSLVRDYGVKDGNVLHLVLKLSDLQAVNVTTACGKEFKFNVERGRDIGYVKRQIAKKGKGLVDFDEQEVLCDGEQLEDQKVIEDICKHNDAVIHLLVRRSAKVRAKPVDKKIELSIVASRLNDRKDHEIEVEDHKRQYDISGENLGSIYEGDREIEPSNSPCRDFLLEPIIVNPKIQIPQVIRDLISSTFEGLDSGIYPVMSMEGTGGAYFMQDSLRSKIVSVFKPMDEEPMAVNNPRGLPLSSDGEGLKKGTRVGEGAFREVAAYILDHPKDGRRSSFGFEKGFSGVPPTVMVKCLHKAFNHPEGIRDKIGSLQMFVESDGSCEDIGPGAFPVQEVHKISVLDMRLANADRHSGNILMSKKGEDGQRMLFPIDHGYCLPESFEDCTFDWLYWPQARQSYSSETVDYIESLDAEEDIALLNFHGWNLPLEAARTLRISTMLLKKGVHKGLTPYTIGSIMCRETVNKESMIEEIVQEAQDTLLPGTSEEAFLEAVSQVMDRRLDEIARPLITLS